MAKTEIFTNKQLKSMIITLFFEQLLVMLVGIADTFVISFAGESAVSGVSLVNQFNTVFLYLFMALASGGAVVISQYIGKKDLDHGKEASAQLLSSSVLFSVVVAVLILVFNAPLMRLMFGEVEPAVMDACVTYLRISAYSYPAIAVYNAGAALYRSFGKTGVTMYISILANVINVIGNIVGVFVLKAGVAGVAYPSLLSRVFSAVVITVLCFSKKNPVYYRVKGLLRKNTLLLKQILRIALPNAFESGIFQFVKVALSSIVALFGTYQIAANGIAQSIWGMAALVSIAMGPVFITVIGQCMGAGDIPEAERYFKKLTKITLIFSVSWNGFILALTPLLMHFYPVEAETGRLVIELVLIHNIFNGFALPLADPLSRGLRAAGDVRFTMYISVFTTVAVRLPLSYLFGITFNLGVIGIAWAMVSDWLIRGVIFVVRQKRGKWKEFRVI